MIDRLQDLIGDPLHKGGHAREGQQILVLTAETVDAGEAVMENPAFEKPVDARLNTGRQGPCFFSQK